MKIAIVGSREYNNLGLVRRFIRSLPEGTIVVSGAARGVDRMAEFAAIKHGYEVDIKPPNVLEHGIPAALFIRNTEIVEASDKLVAFWDGHSKGTIDTLKKAKRAGIPITVYDEWGEEGLNWE